MTPSDDHQVLNALLSAAVDGIIITNADGIMLRVNAAAGALFGYPSEQMVGEHIRMLMPEDMREPHEGYVERYLESRTAHVIGKGREVEAMRHDGSLFPVHIALGEAQVDGKTVFVAMMHDLTHRKAAEEAAARSQRMDAIGRMTGGIAHDFNNLLTVVIGNLELLDLEHMPKNADQIIADALAAAELGADLTSRLVMFARKRPLRLELIDLNAGLASAVSLLRHTISAQCQLDLAMDDNLWPVQADPTQLQTAIFNLVLNAQDAMPEGGRIFLETSNVRIDDTYLAQEIGVAAGRYVRLSVSDTGEGMTDEQRTLALEPFYTTKAAGDGTGLGLSMVYGFTKQAGGHVALYSEPGQGTTVSLYFPAAEKRLEEGMDANSPPTEQQAQGSDRTILIVEDNAQIRRLTEARLGALGFRCISAPDANTAWTLIQAQSDFALVFTDMVMPGPLSGYDLARKIANHYPELPVLITSGFSENVLREKDIGADYPMLRKPYRQADLAEAVYAALAGR
jgi:PAS domain S-box-containing protein